MKWLRPSSLDDERLQEVAKAMRDGALAVIPTDTVYGISTNALMPSAVSKVFQLKRRDIGKPLIVIAHTEYVAKSLAQDWSEDAQNLASAHWPGPLSLIVDANDDVPGLVTANTGKVAIRIPNNPLTLRLLELAGVPLISTSANVSGDRSPTSAEEVMAALPLVGDVEVDWLVDGGESSQIESTVVDTTDGLKVLRQGAIKF